MKRKIISTLLVFCLMLSTVSMTGCSGCQKTPKVEKQKIENAYKVNYISLPEGIDYINNLSTDGKTILVSSDQWNDEYTQRTRLLYRLEENGSWTSFTAPEFDVNESVNLTFFAKDGSVWYISNSYYWDEVNMYSEETYLLKKSDMNGNLYFVVDLSKDIFGRNDDEYSYHYISAAFEDENGNVCLMDSNSSVLYVINSITGKLLNKVNLSETLGIDAMNSNIRSCASVNGELIVVYYDWSSEDSSLQIAKLDSNTLRLKGKLDIPDYIRNNMYNLFVSTDGVMYYTSSDAIFTFNPDTGEAKEVMNYINSDLESNFYNITIIGNSIYSTYYDSLEDYKIKLIKADPIPEDQIVEKYIITLACVSTPYTIKSDIIRFNRNSDEYRIKIKDYSSYNTEDDYSLAGQKFNDDLLAGNIPDIVLLDEKIQFESLVSKGLFVDLNKRFEKDETINRDDYLSNVLDAMSTNGKLYKISPYIYLQTAVGKKSNFPGMKGWTMAEFSKWLKTLPEGTNSFYDVTQDSMLETMLTLAIDSFIDKDTGNCNFDCDEYKQLLQYIKTLDTKSVYETIDYDNLEDDYWEKQENMYRDNVTMLMQESIGDFTALWNLKKYTFKIKDDTDDLIAIGYPNSKKSNVAIVSTGAEIALSAKSELVDGAWEFVKTLLSYESQTSTSKYGFPINKQALEKVAKDALEQDLYYWDYDDGGILYRTGALIDTYAIVNDVVEEDADLEDDIVTEDKAVVWPDYGGDDENVTHLTQEEVDYILELLNSATLYYHYEEQVISIAKEEAAAFFDGKKSVDEAARLTQNRVQTHVSETR